MVNLGEPVITTTDAVRSCIGVDDADVPDELIVGSGWLDDLEYKLAKSMTTWKTLFTNGVSNAPTDQEKAFAAVVKLYGKYDLALRLSKAPMAFPWLISDGKDQMRRNDKINLKDIQADLEAKADAYWLDLLAAYNAIVEITLPVRKPPTLFGSARPDKDPVTGGAYEAG